MVEPVNVPQPKDVPHAETHQAHERVVLGRSQHMPEWARPLMTRFTPELEWKEQHSRAVGNIAKKLGEHHKLSPQEVADLQLAGELHDVGDTATPELLRLVNKTDRLTQDEYTLMQTHVAEGAKLIRGDGTDSHRIHIANLMYGHHLYQRNPYPMVHPVMFDGEDYSRLQESWRMLSLADMVHAQMGERPYQVAGKSPEAVAEDLQQFKKEDGTRLFTDEEIAIAIQGCLQRI